MNTDQKWLTRAEVARRLHVTPMAATMFCARGMPFRTSDGLVPWPDALFWSDWYRAPRRSGIWRARHPHVDPLEEQIEEDARAARQPAAHRWYVARREGTDAASVKNRAIAREAARLMSGSFR